MNSPLPLRKGLPSPDHSGKAVKKIDDLTPLLDVGDVTRILKCSKAVGYKLASSGDIPSIIVAGKLVRFHPDDVRDYIARRRSG